MSRVLSCYHISHHPDDQPARVYAPVRPPLPGRPYVTRGGIAVCAVAVHDAVFALEGIVTNMSGSGLKDNDDTPTVMEGSIPDAFIYRDLTKEERKLLTPAQRKKRNAWQQRRAHRKSHLKRTVALRELTEEAKRSGPTNVGEFRVRDVGMYLYIKNRELTEQRKNVRSRDRIDAAGTEHSQKVRKEAEQLRIESEERNNNLPDTMIELPKRPYELILNNPKRTLHLANMIGEKVFAFDRLQKEEIAGSDVVRYLNLWLGRGFGWKCYVYGRRFTFEYRQGVSTNEDEPTAVYRSWDVSRGKIDSLYRLIDTPYAESNAWSNKTIPDSSKPVPGQQHKVFLVYPPHTLTIKQLVYDLSQIQKNNPHVELVFGSTSSYYTLFGQSFTSGIVDLEALYDNVKIILPSGKVINDDFTIVRKDISNQGCNYELMMRDSVKGSEERFIFNCITAREASELWHTHKRKPHITPTNWRVNYDKPTVYTDKAILQGDVYPDPSLAKPGDKIACDHCSLWRMCSRYREGAVCTVPGTEGKNLAEHFGTTDSTSIVNGLQSIMKTRAERLDRMVEEETFSDEMDPKMDSMLSSLFKDGISLAKLMDPTLARPMVQVNQVNAERQATSISHTPASRADSRQLVSGLVAELEEKGIDRKDITEEMIDEQLRRHTGYSPGGDGGVIDAEVADELEAEEERTSPEDGKTKKD